MMIYNLICNYSNADDIEKASALEVIERLRGYKNAISDNDPGTVVFPSYGMDQMKVMIIGAAVLNGATKINSSIHGLIFDTNKKVCGVELTTGQKIYSNVVICDAVHVPQMTMKVSTV